MRLLFAALGLLLAAPFAGAASVPDASMPVTVRFGDLFWVRAKTLLPRVQDGRTLVPPLEACDLLGLRCELAGNAVRVGHERVPVTRPVKDLPLVPLAPLVQQAGQTVTWDGAAKVAVVSGGTGGGGWRGLEAEVVRGRAPGRDRAYRGRLRVGQEGGVGTAQERGVTLHAERPLQGLTLLSGSTQQFTVTGSLAGSSVDVPNTFPGCAGLSCTLPAPREALWVLASVTAR